MTSAKGAAPRHQSIKELASSSGGAPVAAAVLRDLPTSATAMAARKSLREKRDRWRRDGLKVVFTNGCFDILHPGHISLLERARSLGDKLILALNSDRSVQVSKGPSRPFFSETGRAALAAQLAAVDAVVLFDEPTPRELIAELLPDILVKGADWSHFVAGREEVEAAGGLVVTLDLEPGFSTTDVAAKVLAARTQTPAVVLL